MVGVLGVKNKMDLDLNDAYWDNRYLNNNIGWDLGNISPPIKAYINQLEDRSLKILIPGGGNSYEAEYLHKKGFKNVYVVDVSKTALQNIKKRVPSFPNSNLILKDFFKLKGTFDLVIEQTFFCALNPNLRVNYANKMHQILNPNGKVVGVLFNLPLNDDQPPFGGNKKTYIELFKMHFSIDIMENCYNSEASRKGKELFIKLIKK